MTDFHWFIGVNFLLGILTVSAPYLEKKLEKLEKFFIDYVNSQNEK